MRTRITFLSWLTMILIGSWSAAAPAQWDENGDFVDDEGYREEQQPDNGDSDEYFYAQGVPDDVPDDVPADDQRAEPVAPAVPEPASEPAEDAVEQAGSSEPQDVSYFYDKLAPYGEWLETAEYGWVWHPGGVWEGWRPYTYGRWVSTDLGWTWSSYFPWGWAAMHYGSWSYLDYVGWAWVPGTVWAPAWVIWRYSDAYIGWSPLLAGYGPWFGWAYYPVYYDYWTFMDWHYFCDPHPHHHYIGRRGVAQVFRHTYYPRRCRDGSGVACARGPSRKLVTQRSHVTIKSLRIKNLATARMAGKSTGRSMGVSGDVLKIYRPKLSPGRVSGPASRAGGRLTKTRDLGIVGGRGVSGRTQAPSTGRLTPGQKDFAGPAVKARRPTPGKFIHPRQPNVRRPSIPAPSVRSPRWRVKGSSKLPYKMRAPSYVVPKSKAGPSYKPSNKSSDESSSSKKSSSGSIFKSSPTRSFSHSSSHSSSGGSRHRH